MKKVFAILLCIIFSCGFTGCSELETEHFDKTIYKDITGIHKIDEKVTLSIDPETFGKAIIEISDKMTESNKNKSNGEDIYAPESNVYNDDSEEFLNEFLKAMRAALDENKMFSYSVSVNGAVDFDNMYTDAKMTFSINNINLDCGNVYSRGDKAYIDKKMFYTLGSISYIYDLDMLGRYYEELDKMFADKEYVCMDYTNIGSDLGMNMAGSVVNNVNVLQKAELGLYEQAKDVLKGFDSGCVSKIENGTRFEIKSNEFAEFTTRFASYLRQHSESASDLVNNYINLVTATSKGMYGDEMADEMESFYDEMQVTGDDIIVAMDGLKEVANSPEFAAIFDVLKVTYTNDITDFEGKHKDITVLKGDYNDKTALSIVVDVELNKIDSYEFADLSNKSSIDYATLMSKMLKAQMDLMYGQYEGYSSSSYICPDCGESFEYVDTSYCNECGFVHDFYESDGNCGKQPGCEIAKEAEAKIA